MFQTQNRTWEPPIRLMTTVGSMAILGVLGAITWLVVAIATRLAGIADDDGSTQTAAGALMALTVFAPSRRAAERRYVLDLVLREWLGLDYRLETREGSGVRITADGDPATAVCLPDLLFATADGDWLTERAMPSLPLARVASPSGIEDPAQPDIPVLYGTPGVPAQAWRRTDAGIDLSVDIFGSVFFVLSRYEELVRPERDEHERFPSSASIAVSEGFLGRPIVDEYVDLLWAALHEVWPFLERRPSTFRLRTTHDVDHPWATIGESSRTVARSAAGDVVRRRDPSLAWRRVRGAADSRSGRVDRDPFHTFDTLMAASERNGLRSTFYVLAGNEPGDHDFRYRSDDPLMVRLLADIHDRGHEIGLHGSYASFRSADRIAFEFEALRRACRLAGFEQPAWGVRQHYLRLALPDTWRHHEAAGLEHDSTLGFAEAEGFRAGTGREFPIFDLAAGRALRLRERPLLVMDTTLFVYRRLDVAGATRRACAVVDAARRHGTDAVTLYHNNHVARTQVRRHYDDMIDSMARPVGTPAPA